MNWSKDGKLGSFSRFYFSAFSQPCGSNCEAGIITMIIIIETIVSCWSHSFLTITLKCQSCQVLNTHFPSHVSDFLSVSLRDFWCSSLSTHWNKYNPYWLGGKTENYINNLLFSLCGWNNMIFSSLFLLKLHILTSLFSVSHVSGAYFLQSPFSSAIFTTVHLLPQRFGPL